MTIVLIVALVALLSAGFFVVVSHQHAVVVRDLDDLAGKTRPVDLEAFQNLVDPGERMFLRSRLSASDFHKVERERTGAAIEYVGNIAHNAAILMRLGQAAQASPDAEVVRAATAMVQQALGVRMMAMNALVRLYVHYLVPSLAENTQDVFERYRRLTDAATLFTRLQRPAFAGRVSAML